jgi:hypothetical protein
MCKAAMSSLIHGPMAIVSRLMEDPQVRVRHENISRVAILEVDKLAEGMHVSVHLTHSPRFLAGTVLSNGRDRGDAVIRDDRNGQIVSVPLSRILDLKAKSTPVSLSELGYGARVSIRQSKPEFHEGFVVRVDRAGKKLIVLGEQTRTLEVFSEADLSLGLNRTSPRTPFGSESAVDEATMAIKFEGAGYEGGRSVIHSWNSRQASPAEMVQSMRMSISALEGAHAIDQVVIHVADGSTYGAKGPHLVSVTGAVSIRQISIDQGLVSLPELDIAIPVNQIRGIKVSSQF